MKSQSRTLLSGVALLASALLFSHTAIYADSTVVAWGPSSDYVGGHTTGVGLVSGGVVFSDEVARNPGAPYPNGLSSGIFYGGAISSNTSGITVWRISNGSSNGNDSITFASPLAASETATALYLWKKADFLAGYSTQPAKVTSFSATLQHTGAGATLTGKVRWVVQVAGSYYVSDSFSTTTSVGQYTLSDPSSVSWFSLAPASSLTSIGAQWESPDFSNVSGVGLWYQLAATGTVTLAAANISEFTVAAIPEPASAAFLLGGVMAGIAAVVFRRR